MPLGKLLKQALSEFNIFPFPRVSNFGSGT
jgi:hypothetical protein